METSPRSDPLSLLVSPVDQYLRYSRGLEKIEPDERETCDRIGDLMSQGADALRRKSGHPARISHAKAHGAVTGKFIVHANLPDHLRQGLFAGPGKTYDVLLRLAHTPSATVDERTVSPPRGIAIKVLGVDGDQLVDHACSTQDFLFSTGKTFMVPSAKTFLQAVRRDTELALERSDTLMEAAGVPPRAPAKSAMFFGMESSHFDFADHPFLHPLAECYYSQTPFRYGDHVAKFCVKPVTPGLKALAGKPFEPQDANGMRIDVVEFFKHHDAEFVFGVQLATNSEDFSIEDANAEWPEDESPFQEVARIVIPAQDAYEAAKVAYIESLSFSPAHSLAAHRPLGSLNRARMYAYAVVAQKRRNELGVTQIEPDSIATFTT